MDYRPRLLDRTLRELFGSFPALMIVGPRACGKTTTATRLVESVVRLDQPIEAAAFEADPDAALRRLAEPILLDEWQSVPGVVGAVKRAVDADSRPGRFILTGSTRSALEGASWPGTGRILRLALYPMSVREQMGLVEGPTFFEKVSTRADLAGASDEADLGDYVDLALRGGFPEPLTALSPAEGARWLAGYVEEVTTRETDGPGSRSDPAKLRGYLEALAVNSAGVVQEKTLYETAGISRTTALSYERLLGGLYLLDVVPAWWENRLKRLVRAPKRYLVDPAIMGGALGLDAGAVLRDGNLLGSLLDTFVAAQLRAELAQVTPRPRLHHLRTEQGRREVDLVIELGGGRVIAVEVKASAGPKPDAARHLGWLRDALGERFVAGLVLHTGTRTWSLGDRVTAAPISSIWAPV